VCHVWTAATEQVSGQMTGWMEQVYGWMRDECLVHQASTSSPARLAETFSDAVTVNATWCMNPLELMH